MTESVGFRRPLDLTPEEIDRGGAPLPVTTRQLPSTPSFELTDSSGDDGIARQRTLVGDSLNDEQWGDDLSSQSH